MYKLIIFDLDGTLIDTSLGIVKGVLYIAKLYGYEKLSKKEAYQFIGPPLKYSMMTYLQLYGESLDEAIKKYRERYRAKGMYEATIYTGIVELLEALKKQGIYIGVATLKQDELAHRILDEFRLTPYIDTIHGIDNKDTLMKKDLILECIKDIPQMSINEAVMVGDTIYDATASKEAGVAFIALTYGFGFKENKMIQSINPIFIANTVEQLKNYLLRGTL